jgi:hypothetical protein
MAPALKTIVYRGGVVTFRIPESWTEQYGAEGGGEFYEDAPDSPTLRLNVLTFRGPNATAEAAATTLKEKCAVIEHLPNGAALARYERATEEQGEELELTTWELAQALPPEHLRVLVFTWTILTSQRDDPRIRADFELLDREIRAASLSTEVGSEPPRG